MKNVSLFLLLALSFSCTSSPPKTVVEGVAALPKDTEARLQLHDTMYVDTLHEGRFHFDLPAATEGYAFLLLNKHRIPLWLSPMDSLCLQMTKGKGKVRCYTGKHNGESYYLRARAQRAHQLGMGDVRAIDRALFALPFAAFQDSVNEKARQMEAFLQEYQVQEKKLSTTLVEAEQLRLRFWKQQQALLYAQFYPLLTQKEVVYPKGYHLWQVELSEQQAMLFNLPVYQWVAEAYLKADGATIEEQYDKAQQLWGRTPFFEKLIFRLVNKHINSHGVEQVKPFLGDLLRRLKNTKQREYLSRKCRAWLALTPGKKAPDFSTKDAQGKEWFLSDLSGKWVYIDCWESHCGPCIAQLPALKQLAKEMKGKNFLVVTIAADTQEKRWLEKCEQYELEYGLNLFTGGMKHPFYADYQVKAFPRYLLIDPQRRIVSAVAPKPSQIAEIKALMDSFSKRK